MGSKKSPQPPKKVLNIAKVNSESRKSIALEKYCRNKSLSDIAKKYGITRRAVSKSIKITKSELIEMEKSEKK